MKIADFGEVKLNICIFLSYVQLPTTEKVLKNYFYFVKGNFITKKKNLLNSVILYYDKVFSYVNIF